MEEVRREVRPRIDLNQEFTEVYPWEPGCDLLGECRGARGPCLCLAGCQDEPLVFDPQVAVFACQAPVHLDQPIVQLRLPRLETRLGLPGCPGLAEYFRPLLGPHRGGNEIARR